MHILLIEDDEDTARYLGDSLKSQGHTCELCHDGHSGLARARENSHDVMIVDRMLPRMDGLALVRQLRQEGTATPILFLTAMADVSDRVDGLTAGADDYLIKPFALTELLARLEAIARRHHRQPDEACLRVGSLELNRLTRKVTRGDRTIELRAREFELLEYLMQHAGQLVTRTMLLENVWNYHFDPQTNIVDVHISHLRAKLGSADQPVLLHTIRGQGYSLHG